MIIEAELSCAITIIGFSILFLEVLTIGLSSKKSNKEIANPLNEKRIMDCCFEKDSCLYRYTNHDVANAKTRIGIDYAKKEDKNACLRFVMINKGEK